MNNAGNSSTDPQHYSPGTRIIEIPNGHQVLAPSNPYLKVLTDHASILIVLIAAIIWKRLIQPMINNAKVKMSYTLADEALIEQVLSQFLAVGKADRVILFECHNGEINPDGKHLHKLTATQEITAPGVTTIAHQYQGVPLNNFGSAIYKMQSINALRTVVSEIETDFCRSHFLANGVEFAISRMFTVGEIPLAILQFHYCRGQRLDFDQFNVNKEERLLAQLYSKISNKRTKGFRKLVDLLNR